MVRANINPDGEPAFLDKGILNYQNDFETVKGKFIRLGELVVVSPYGKLALSYHRTLLRWAQEQDLPDITVRTRPHDSGHFYLATTAIERADLPPDLELALPEDLDAQDSGLVVVHGKSDEYGRAQQPGRDQTSELFRAAVAGEAVVIGV